MSEKLKGINKIELAVFIGLLMTIIFSCTYGVIGFNESCEDIRDSMLRLHVIANSDSDEDQSLKLLVRDTVLESGADIFDGSVNVENAKTKLTPRIDELERAAEKIVSENGFDYDVTVKVGEEYFDTRTYGNVTLPAGEYKAVRVIIGEGKGNNWWCVMFPPMCLPAAQGDTGIDAYLENDEVKLVESNPKFEPRFKVVEIYERIRNCFG